MAKTGEIIAPVQDGKLEVDYLKNKKEAENKAIGTKLGYDQFLSLLCAEMQYQDPLEPTSNTEYVAQLATFSQLEATLSMATTQKNNMANSLVGKYVILKPTDATTGETTYVDGKVDYIAYEEDGSILLSVNGNTYSMDTLDTVADSDYYEAQVMAKTFSGMIAQMPDVANINLSYETAVKQIREVYKSMTTYQQSFVSKDDLAKLEAFEKRIEEIKNASKTEDSKNDTSDGDDSKTEDNGQTDEV